MYFDSIYLYISTVLAIAESNESVIQNDIFILYYRVRKQNQQMKTGNFMHKTNNTLQRTGGML